MRNTSASDDYGEYAASATDCSETDDDYDDSDVSETSSVTNNADVLSGLAASLISSQQSGLPLSTIPVLPFSVVFLSSTKNVGASRECSQVVTLLYVSTLKVQ